MKINEVVVGDFGMAYWKCGECKHVFIIRMRIPVDGGDGSGVLFKSWREFQAEVQGHEKEHETPTPPT